MREPRRPTGSQVYSRFCTPVPPPTPLWILSSHPVTASYARLLTRPLNKVSWVICSRALAALAVQNTVVGTLKSLMRTRRLFWYSYRSFSRYEEVLVG